MKAVWNNRVIAEADKDELIYIEGNWYFPPASVKQEFLRKSDTPYTCPWKGVCQYFNVGLPDEITSPSDRPSASKTVSDSVRRTESMPPSPEPVLESRSSGQTDEVISPGNPGEGDNWSKDVAWSYPDPKPSAIDAVKKDFSSYVAFWRDVKVSET